MRLRFAEVCRTTASRHPRADGSTRSMRTALFAAIWSFAALTAAHAQNATVVAQVVLREAGEPLAFTTVSVFPHGYQRLTTERGMIVLRDLAPGEIHLRFRRIGFSPKDTTIPLIANDTARLRIEMTRLVLQLPVVVVNGACTNRTPLEEKPAVVSELLDQVRQNAERMRLLATERPFVFQAVSVSGMRDRNNNIVGQVAVDTVERGPLPLRPYVPGGVVYRAQSGAWIVMLPELPHLADTAFTNNHCLWYAGQERFGADSVVRVDFEPVPWLAKEVDLEGSIYLRVEDYQLVGLDTKLNRIPLSNRAMVAYSNRARFGEIVSGVPVLAEWELTNVMRGTRPNFVQTGRVTGITWLESLEAKRDTTTRPRR